MTAITLAEAQDLAARCHGAAQQEGLRVVAAISDPGGHLVLLARMDGAIAGANRAAEAKARTAVLYDRPTRAFAESYRAGRPVHMLPDVMPLGGGIPLYRNGQLAGALGLSGAVEDVETRLAERVVAAFTLG
ncbi:heme-binding protein [Pseudooceanicola sp. CBS1P-1]|uniref:Heme-binding protein n=1 Tax=Pseudooceanicola albus TaxID=2692189 RepID=A0A6L7G810_9RHOB|nr:MULTISPECIES: heme-binding protein [Pseudooceanicola]MBT9385318.1 heme-binding protein [Pseudooceanicola endophyticus]MXN18823.1 heme-binding protein [Pseudooceanicola albus]